MKVFALNFILLCGLSRLNDQDMEYKDMSENILNRREIDQLKEMLEEKDRHIGDLTDTLTHFHVRISFNSSPAFVSLIYIYSG